MSEPKPSGGLAFPGSDGMQTDTGMSLRDWFAGQALSSMLSPDRLGNGGSESTNSAKCFARSAYDLADAMIAARDV